MSAWLDSLDNLINKLIWSDLYYIMIYTTNGSDRIYIILPEWVNQQMDPIYITGSNTNTAIHMII